MNKQVEAFTYRDTFLNVMALYSVLHGTPQQGVRRAELKQGEVTPEAIDFTADVEIKAKRTLSPLYYKVLLQLAAEDKYELFPIDLQCQLGQVFWEHDLNYDGDYRILYFRAKNARLQDHEQGMQFPEEAVNVEDLLS